MCSVLICQKAQHWNRFNQVMRPLTWNHTNNQQNSDSNKIAHMISILTLHIFMYDQNCHSPLRTSQSHLHLELQRKKQIKCYILDCNGFMFDGITRYKTVLEKKTHTVRHNKLLKNAALMYNTVKIKQFISDSLIQVKLGIRAPYLVCGTWYRSSAATCRRSAGTTASGSALVRTATVNASTCC